ncbi:50S ribosomal protein L24 [Idiomarina loihiensis]|jgi:large subunit ribosomal protein L24|uniref:Large ribosomal subunit protein uL24 n=1 Tax=Idiomarina loihiensis (strain ATCC BAA-735 / DSM 15497 / L2-TR) TaxID=283942 RepID=RL24_IDILO|nr:MULTISPECIES: 50S ribosomal protein L24 [Idiomarina]Q5QXW9.1 RecName: Full=Large ribosomal subunit protein uL24; AltName: Full=50S ribosomal protein L24 [Idiomarina loihiensis L2TR]MAA63025.1 50S ribosomal protein L24 [Idiomarina sp.]AAV82737.1 Ribosomal protein L24 [Idiomarina loihiensis L2TR]AGM36779.1 50S ribosomal protein L24 [Idiomarina loihiensis GSL 199]MBL4741756.1 50S ribosomal protein L24 [Idiomarina sp.]MBL4855946.1 50S ribosomal protein L24 [Idiomarina sp.]|tara:strand:+ start:64658 stop:64972 length:315 start_codon:yes stop_codon:yes gene_type:complete
MAAKIKRDDEVVVLAGKDKGKQGKVLKVLTDKDRVIVEGVNVVKKHQKPNPALGESGGIVEQEAAIHISNVAILNPETGKADRVGFRLEDGKKVRFFKSNNAII